MDIIQMTSEYLNQQDISALSPDDYCPNCWGRQEYGGDYYEALKDEGVNSNNLEKKKGWIQAYADRFLIGIKLKPQGTTFVCNTCQTIENKE